MAYDGQAPAQMTMENGDAVYEEFAASKVKTFVLTIAQLVEKGIEVKLSPGGTTLTSPEGRVVKAKRKGSLLFLPTELIAMEPFKQDEEERLPEHGERVGLEADVREAGEGGAFLFREASDQSTYFSGPCATAAD